MVRAHTGWWDHVQIYFAKGHQLNAVTWAWIAEDSDADFETLQYLLSNVAVCPSVRRFTCGEEILSAAQQLLAGDGFHPWPAFVLLDLNLPGTDGRAVLEHIKQDDALRRLPVIVMSTSANPKDIDLCYRLGANAYVTKPMGLDEYQERVRSICEFWLQTALPAIRR